MIILNESAIANIICEAQMQIERGTKKLYERSGKPGQGIDTGMREIYEGIGYLKATQMLMYKAHNVPQKATVDKEILECARKLIDAVQRSGRDMTYKEDGTVIIPINIDVRAFSRDHGATLDFERTLHNKKHSSRLCPVCREERAVKRNEKRQEAHPRHEDQAGRTRPQSPQLVLCQKHS